ncbi:MAG: glycine zipper domain-containing protein [Desulfofustis sp.]|jgi:surface antigen
MIGKQLGIFFSLLIIIQVAAAGCTRTQQGAAIGGAAGGLTGYMLTKDEDQVTQIAAVVAGAAVGGLIGGVIGNYMDKADEERLQKELRQTPTGEERHWTNPQTGHRFTIKPLSDVQTDSEGRRYREATLYGRQKGSDKLDVATEKIYLDNP